MNRREELNLETAKAYVLAVCGGDFAKARSFLHHTLTFRSVSGTHQSADAFMASVRESVGAVANGHVMRRELAAQDHVVLSYDFLTKTPAGALPCTEWYTMRDGKISEMELFFDPRPLMPR